MQVHGRRTDRVRRRLQPIHRKFAGYLPLQVRRQYLYLAGHRRLARLDSPSLFTEKVNWRIVNDRRDLLSWTCDKLAMREYAKNVAGGLGISLPDLLWSGANIREIEESQFDVDWVLKPNHRSGLVQFHPAGTRVDLTLQRSVSDWLQDDQGVLLGEWAYSQARRLLLVERNILPHSDLPDYKFFVFSGQVLAIQFDQDRFCDHSRSFYSRDWSMLGVKNRFPLGRKVEPPQELETMCEIAEVLGKPFDFIRVDLYLAEGKVWFGEVTPYPGGGVEPFDPKPFDKWLGDQWQLPEIYSEPGVPE